MAWCDACGFDLWRSGFAFLVASTCHLSSHLIVWGWGGLGRAGLGRLRLFSTSKKMTLFKFDLFTCRCGVQHQVPSFWGGSVIVSGSVRRPEVVMWLWFGMPLFQWASPKRVKSPTSPACLSPKLCDSSSSADFSIIHSTSATWNMYSHKACSRVFLSLGKKIQRWACKPLKARNYI